MQSSEMQIAVISLGDAGLPIALEVGKSRLVVGFDIKVVALTQEYLATIFRPQVAWH